MQVLVADQPRAEIDELIATLRSVELPVTFAELGKTDGVSQAEMRTIVDATLAADYSRNMAPQLASEGLARCLEQADRAGKLAHSGAGV